MSTLIAAVVYGAFAVGYVAMLVLTERTAGRYVRGEIRPRYARHQVTLVPARAQVAPAPQASPLAERAAA